MMFFVFENFQPLYPQILHVSNFSCPLTLELQLNKKILYVSCVLFKPLSLCAFFFSGYFCYISDSGKGTEML